jgi:hypothetical protein
VHWASSLALADPASAPEPECTGLVVTWSVAAHVQPDSVPVSKPGFANRLAAAVAVPAPVVASAPAASAVAARAAVASRAEREMIRVRFMRPPASGRRGRRGQDSKNRPA